MSKTRDAYHNTPFGLPLMVSQADTLETSSMPVAYTGAEDVRVVVPVVSFGGTSKAGTDGTNRDSFGACQPKDVALRRHRGVVMVIADGVGSSKTSRVASDLMVTEFIDEYLGSGNTRSVRNCAAKTIQTLNSWLYAQNAPNRAGGREGDGLMTTFTAIVVKSCTAHVFHVGDSRAWLIRDGDAQPLTRDHQVRSNGRLLLARALGADLSVEVDHLEINLREGDVIGLTTDGIHGELSTSEVSKVLLGSMGKFGDDLEAASADTITHVRTLLARGTASAKNAPKYDDATCLFTKIEALPSRDEVEVRRRALAVVIPPVMKAGMSIDDLKVIKTIHESTRSHVYLVHRKSDDRELILKAPSINFSDDALYLQGFARECWLLNSFDHASLLKGVSPIVGSPYLYSLSENIAGDSLRQWMIDHPKPSMSELRPLLASIVDGLRVLRRAGIIHRDLKPENILVGEDNQCTIIDFGTARVDGLEELGTSLSEEVPVGAVGYVAPESLLGSIDWRVDLYSLAVITFEALTGTQPTDKANTGGGDAQKIRHAQKPLTQLRTDIPQWVEFTLDKALSLRPEARHTTYSEFLADLQRPSIEAKRVAGRLPLAEKHPVVFWKVMSAILFVALCASIILQNR